MTSVAASGSPPTAEVTLHTLEPFGLVARFPLGTDLRDVPTAAIHRWVADHRVLILRGLSSIERVELPGIVRRLGPLQAWAFGSIHELVVKPATENYLYTDHDVPLHWDGAFVGRAPRYLVFHCVEAPEPGAGGETIFVDTGRVFAGADRATRDKWRSLRFRYATEKRVHYGGSFVSPLVVQHEVNGGTVMRFAEPVDDLNAVSVEALGLDPLASAAQIGELRDALTAPGVTLAHPWEAGDVVIADNLALLHGRRAFLHSTPRRIRRVNVHTEARSFRDDIRAALRIRRPEFMVAEIPILVIPLLLSGARFEATSWLEITVMFFLLFHVGDMVNCLADRDLDAVYKTHLSEAVYGLGVRSVTWQIAMSSLFALAIAAEISSGLRSVYPLVLVAGGLLLGLQYSLRPLWLKGRGVLQIATLWALIFVGPMALVWTSLGADLEPPILALFAAYGLMQQGIVLVNTAEDLPEDRAMNIRTSAVSLGLEGAITLAFAMVAIGAGVVLTVLGQMLLARGRPVALALMPLSAAVTWVLRDVWVVRKLVSVAEEQGELAAIAAMRPRARRVPLWITATAVGALSAALVVRC